MRRELITKSRNLVGTSDLTLLAPIRPGLVPSFNSISHKSRIKSLLQALNAGRSSAHEYALLRPFSDAVERVGKIHSVRVAVLEPENQVLLAVTFDGSWEAYLRVLWQKVGTLLDIIFYDTEGYVCAYDRPYDEWAGWVRRVQVETHFYYGTPALTVGDVPLLQAEERQRRACPYQPGNELAAARRHGVGAEAAAWQQVTASPATGAETFKQGLEAMAALYRLTEVYQPGTDDGQVLLRAVRDLLLEFVRLLGSGAIPPPVMAAARVRFDKQLAWLQQQSDAPRERQRVAPPLPDGPPVFDAADVQAGILSAHDGVTDGALLLLAITDRVRAAPFFRRLAQAVRRHSDPPATAADTLVNVGFSHEGLRAAGLAEDELALFPQEFREGMAARASLLGDCRLNHPRRWRLPPRRGAVPGPDGQVPRVEWEAVHLVLQLRWVAPPSDRWCEIEDPCHPLHGRFAGWAEDAESHGLALLAVQTLHRYFRDARGAPAGTPPQVEEHFGYADGNSDPVLDPAEAGQVYPNRIQLGELLVGAANEADWPLDPERRADPALERQRLAWLGNGSFMVLRKLAQNRARLDRLVAEAAAASGLAPGLLRAKLMGRWDDGTPLVGTGGPGAAHNDFDYRADPDGAQCPFHAHIRRVNPRQPPGLHEPAGRRTPRIARRGMSYGPRYTAGTADAADAAGAADAQAERGLVFMAYNASLAEQFEVLQGWLSGGNSSGAGSEPSDPFLGVPANGRRRHYRFEHPGADGQPRVVSLALDGSDTLLGDPEPIVRLDWGGYLFAPSMSALQRLCDRAARAVPPPEPAWSVAEGAELIAALRATEAAEGAEAAAQAWKAALEDPIEQQKFRAASIWAALRAQHAGVLRTPYGLLVADPALALQVLRDAARFSVRGYHERLAQSIGDIYLGQDPDARYDAVAGAVNAAIGALPREPAFELTRRCTAEVLAAFIAEARRHPNPAQPAQWELMLELRELIEPVLGRLCQHWFGMPVQDTPDVRLSGRRWDAGGQTACYPGHFTAPSRYVFQPLPGAQAQALGRDDGRVLTAAFTRFVRDRCAHGGWPLPAPDGRPAPVAEAIWRRFGGPQADAAFIARTLVGTMMGMLPTLDGNLQRVLNEWLYEGTLWSLRAQWLALEAGERSFDAATRLLGPPLRQAMQLRPVPELVWRTATAAAPLGPLVVQPGERVVVALVSASQQALADGDPDLALNFGGDRGLPRHPPHACPGQEAAMGALLGFLAGLLDTPGAMRPSPLPLVLTFDGPFVAPPAPPAAT
ncbi:MAG: hypothetical protein KGJ24_01555 [Burkholderiales bacterium]|nr:hypothetical protein [Burkholderiales bacterium]